MEKRQGTRNIPRLVVSICHYRDVNGLLECLASIFAQPPQVTFEVHVASNSEELDLRELLHDRYGSRVTFHEVGYNSGYAHANNGVLKAVGADYYLVLNPDTTVCAGAIDQLVGVMAAQPRLGIVGPELVNPDGSYQRNFSRDPSLLHYLAEALWIDRVLPGLRHPVYSLDHTRAAPFQTTPLEVVDWISGACMLLRREAVETVGFFDEAAGFMAEDQLICRAVRRSGWLVGSTSTARVVHKGQRSQRLAVFDWQIRSAQSQADYFRRTLGVGGEVAFRIITGLRCLLRLAATPLRSEPGAWRRERKILLEVGFGLGRDEMPPWGLPR